MGAEEIEKLKKLTEELESIQTRLKKSEDIRVIAEYAREKAEEARVIAEDARATAGRIREEIFNKLREIFRDV